MKKKKMRIKAEIRTQNKNIVENHLRKKSAKNINKIITIKAAHVELRERKRSKEKKNFTL